MEKLEELATRLEKLKRVANSDEKDEKITANLFELLSELKNMENVINKEIEKINSELNSKYNNFENKLLELKHYNKELEKIKEFKLNLEKEIENLVSKYMDIQNNVETLETKIFEIVEKTDIQNKMLKILKQKIDNIIETNENNSNIGGYIILTFFYLIINIILFFIFKK